MWTKRVSAFLAKRGRVLDPAAIPLASFEDEVGCISGWASPDGSLQPLATHAFAEAFSGLVGLFHTRGCLLASCNHTG